MDTIVTGRDTTAVAACTMPINRKHTTPPHSAQGRPGPTTMTPQRLLSGEAAGHLPSAPPRRCTRHAHFETALYTAATLTHTDYDPVLGRASRDRRDSGRDTLTHAQEHTYP